MKKTITLISVILAAVMLLPAVVSAYNPDNLPVAGVDVASDEVIFALDYTNPDVAVMELFPIYAENYEELNENHTYGERKAGPISEFAELIGIPFPVTFADMLDPSVRSTVTPEGKYIPNEKNNTTFCIRIKDISVHETIKILEANPYIKYAQYNYIYQPEEGTTGNNSLPFTDVMTGKWYTEPVTRLYEMGIVKGVSKDKFAPSQVTTRAMMTEILYRVDKKFGRASADAAKPEGYKPFTDVEGKWYYGAANWANLTGVVRGYPDGSFRGDRPITRAEAATILYRYLKFTGLAVKPAEDDGKMRFTDSDDIPSWAREAVKYLSNPGLMAGVSDNIFDPNGEMTRAMVATVAYRVVKEYEKQDEEPVTTGPQESTSEPNPGEKEDIIVEIQSSSIYPDFDLAVSVSDAIVKGEVIEEYESGHSNPTGKALNAIGETIPYGIVTKYSFRVDEVYKGDLKPGDVISLETVLDTGIPDADYEKYNVILDGTPFELTAGQSGIFLIAKDEIWTEPASGDFYVVVHGEWGFLEGPDSEGFYSSGVYKATPAQIADILHR